MNDYAHRARSVAQDVLELSHQLAAERSARTTLQTRCNQLQAIIGQAAYQAADEHAFADIPWPDA